jgi:hypothetical protein
MTATFAYIVFMSSIITIGGLSGMAFVMGMKGA